jgi:hypothetical protein
MATVYTQDNSEEVTLMSILHPRQPRSAAVLKVICGGHACRQVAKAYGASREGQHDVLKIDGHYVRLHSGLMERLHSDVCRDIVLSLLHVDVWATSVMFLPNEH